MKKNLMLFRQRREEPGPDATRYVILKCGN
jgi:hypothetical protein